MLLTISTLFYGKPEVSRTFLHYLEITLKDRKDVQVIIRNQSPLSDKGVSEAVAFRSGLRNLVYSRSSNKGFGAGHNENLLLADGKYFLAINNDLFLQDTAWIDKIIQPLEINPKVGLVGLEGAPCTFRPDGSGFAGRHLEYLEGSFVVGRTEDFRKFGLFSEAFPMFFGEDSDLSMKFRQMGQEIMAVPIAHQHPRSQSLSIINPEYKNRIFAQNKDRLHRKWGRYLVNKTFSNRILVVMDSLGIGDLLSFSPILEELRKEHPTAIIELTTSCPDLFIGNPHINELYEIKRNYPKAYDRVIQIRPNYSSYKTLPSQAEEIAVVKNASHKPQIFLTGMEAKEGAAIVNSVREEEGQIVVGVATQMARTIWQGRNWSQQSTKELIKLLQDSGIKVIELGKGFESTGEADLDLIGQTTLRQYFSVIANLDFLVTIDSLALHVAQTFGIPTFALFMATEAIARILDFGHVYPIIPQLDCVGCYQRNKPTPDTNVCELGNPVGFESCVAALKPQEIFDIMMLSKEDLLARNIKYLQKWMWREKP